MVLSTICLVRGQNKIKSLCSFHCLVQGPLEYESYIAALTSQLLYTERTGRVEGMCAVRQWDLAPEAGRLL